MVLSRFGIGIDRGVIVAVPVPMIMTMPVGMTMTLIMIVRGCMIMTV
jgi:hypothetical protein